LQWPWSLRSWAQSIGTILSTLLAFPFLGILDFQGPVTQGQTPGQSFHPLQAPYVLPRHLHRLRSHKPRSWVPPEGTMSPLFFFFFLHKVFQAQAGPLTGHAASLGIQGIRFPHTDTKLMAVLYESINKHSPTKKPLKCDFGGLQCWPVCKGCQRYCLSAPHFMIRMESSSGSPLGTRSWPPPQTPQSRIVHTQYIR
jgi:hypothetical protein